MRGFDRRGMLLGAAAALAAGRAAAQVAIERRGSSMLPEPSDYAPPETLKAVFDLYRRMTAPVRVNGRGPYPFVIDTGANQSVIADSLAVELGLKAGSPELLHSATGAEMAPTTAARLDIGDRREEDVILSVLPQASLGGLGMLGVDRLAGQRLTLDFARRRIVIEPSGRAWRDPGDVVLKTQRRDGQLTLVDAELAGAPITAFLDSGAESTIGNLALKAVAAAQHPAATWIEAPVLSVTGQIMQAEMAGVPGLRIGGLHLPAWPVAFADLHTFALWGLTARPALMIGVDILSRFSAVSLDFARDEVRFHDVAMGAWTQTA
jgi:Aspartyl protease